MKFSHFLIAFATVALAACAGTPGYVAADGADGYGYSEQAIGDNQYRITFNGRQMLRDERLAEYVLRRAAEITVRDGYEWFVIANPAQPVASTGDASEPRFFRTQAIQSMGPGGLQTGKVLALGSVRSAPDLDQRSFRPRMSITIDITLGEGPAPLDQMGFFAKDVLDIPEST